MCPPFLSHLVSLVITCPFFSSHTFGHSVFFFFLYPPSPRFTYLVLSSLLHLVSSVMQLVVSFPSLADETRVFGLQTEAMGPGRSDVFLRYKFGSEGSSERPLVMREVTACYRFRLAQYRQAGSMFLSYAYSDIVDNALLFCK